MMSESVTKKKTQVVLKKGCVKAEGKFLVFSTKRKSSVLKRPYQHLSIFKNK